MNAVQVKELPWLKGVRHIYTEFYYDGPMMGLCWYEDKVCKFYGDFIGDEGYLIFELKGSMLIRALAEQKMFEITVGYHNTHRGDGSRIENSQVEASSFHSDWNKACRDIEALIPGLPPFNKDEQIAIGRCKSIF